MTSVFVLLTASLLELPARPSYDVPLHDRAVLELEARSMTQFAGEAAHLTLRLRNTSDRTLDGWFMLSPGAGKALVYVRRDAEAFDLLDHFASRGSGFQQWTRLNPEDSVSQDFVAALNPSTGSPLLDKPGDYEFYVEYVDLPGEPNSRIESRHVTIKVQDAPSRESAALTAYRNGLAFFAEFRAARHDATPEQIESAIAFYQSYRTSVYWKDVRDGLWAALHERVVANVASDSERAFFEKLKREWVDDTTPPTLSVTPTPTSLWPTNHKLKAVQVATDVKDDVDPNPIVTLVSITCDDACDPSQDIVGATYGTDDREFELRAERSGTRSGRTYKILYEAVDNAGNRAASTATVSVPHDQSK